MQVYSLERRELISHEEYKLVVVKSSQSELVEYVSEQYQIYKQRWLSDGLHLYATDPNTKLSYDFSIKTWVI